MWNAVDALISIAADMNSYLQFLVERYGNCQQPADVHD
jgi:hypothetical protein